jgi:hypothetical protein
MSNVRRAFMIERACANHSPLQCPTKGLPPVQAVLDDRSVSAMDNELQPPPGTKHSFNLLRRLPRAPVLVAKLACNRVEALRRVGQLLERDAGMQDHSLGRTGNGGGRIDPDELEVWPSLLEHGQDRAGAGRQVENFSASRQSSSEGAPNGPLRLLNLIVGRACASPVGAATVPKGSPGFAVVSPAHATMTSNAAVKRSPSANGRVP